MRTTVTIDDELYEHALELADPEMKGVLIDTSIGVNHFRYHNYALVELLQLDMVWTHPMIMGELACETLPARDRTLSAIGLLQQTRQASVREVRAFIEYKCFMTLAVG